MKQRSRIIGYDYLRILSIFMVVTMHGLVAFLNGNTGAMELVAMEINVVCLIAVPCFFMLSGALVLEGENERPFDSLKKRLVKQGIPFALWSLVYVFARIAMKKIPFGIQAFTGLLQEPAYYQFWFMYSLLAIYLLLPVLNSLLHSLSQKVFRYLLVVWLVFSVLQPTLARFDPALRLSEHVDLILCEGYLGYFLLGYYLKQYGTAVPKKTAAWMLTGGSLLTMGLVWLETAFAGDRFLGLFYNSYLTPGVVLASCGAFLLFQNWNFRSNRLTTTMSELSIGIYYVHMLVMTAFEYIGFSGSDDLMVCVAKVVATYIVSAVITWIMSKIPGLRKVFLGIDVAQ